MEAMSSIMCRSPRGGPAAGTRAVPPGRSPRRRPWAQVRLGSLSVDPTTAFPGESSEHRLARNQLLEAEIELRRAIERVAAQRRELPPGGAAPDDYVFEEAADAGGVVKFSELFAPGK